MEKNEKTINPAVETYAGDMAEVLKNDPGGLVKKIIHGEEEHEAQKRNLSPESKRNQLFMFASIALFLLSLGTLSFFILKTNNNTVPVEGQFTPLIFNDQSKYLEVAGLGRDEIIQTVRNEVTATKVKTGGVEGIYLTENKQIVGLRRFLNLIKSNFTPDPNPFLVSDNFLLGAVNTTDSVATPDVKTSPGFFILLKVRSTADIFDTLRASEPKMFSDLHGFAGVDVSADTKYLLTKDWEDGVVENKNARLLHDTYGKIVLMYVFADDNSVIVSNSQSAAGEVMLRLAAGRKKQ